MDLCELSKNVLVNFLTELSLPLLPKYEEYGCLLSNQIVSATFFEDKFLLKKFGSKTST